MSGLTKWTDLRGKDVDHIPQIYYGFFYILYFEDGTQYCGIKKLNSDTKIKARKDGKERDGHVRFTFKIQKNKRVPYEILKKQSNWRSYTGSYDKKVYKDNTLASRVIVQLFQTKRAMTFYEADFQFRNDVLFVDQWRNANILGKMHNSFGEDAEIFDDRRKTYIHEKE